MGVSLVVALLYRGPIAAEESGPTKGFWNVLVTPKAKWTLPDTIGKSRDSVVVETYDVRKVGNADVARLRWTHVSESGRDDITDDVPIKQVAVTDTGMYLLDKDQGDASILEALKQKPSRSDPPKPYKASAKNGGRYLRIEKTSHGPIACMGNGPLPNAGDCEEDVCYGELCVSPKAGIVRLEGLWAPDHDVFEIPEFKNH